MAGAQRAFYLPTLLAGAQTAAASIVTNLATLNAADSAFSTFGAAGDLYALPHYLKKALDIYRAWVLLAEIADAAIDPIGGPPGTLSNVQMTGTLVQSDTAGGARVQLVLTSIGSNPGTSLTSVTLDNTAGWLTPLGFEHGVSTVYNASGGVVTMLGDFQPRTLFTFPASEIPGEDRRRKSLYLAHVGADGHARTYDAGSSLWVRTYKLIDQDVSYGADDYPVGVFASIDGTRKILTLKADTSGSLTGLGGLYYASGSLLNQVQVGDWVSVGNYAWASRVKARDANAGTITLWEPFPSSASTSLTAGQEVYVISEAAALQLEWERLGQAAIVSNDDLNQVPLWGAYRVYAPDTAGAEDFARRSLADPYYSWTFNLVRDDLPGWALP